MVLSLGLGLSLLVTLALIEGNLRRQLTSTLPKQAPSFFFLDVASAEAERFNAFIRDHSPSDARLDEVPMLRGRIASLKGVPVEEIKPDPEAAWVLQSDRGITFAEDVPEGSAIVEGAYEQLVDPRARPRLMPGSTPTADRTLAAPTLKQPAREAS